MAAPNHRVCRCRSVSLALPAPGSTARHREPADRTRRREDHPERPEDSDDAARLLQLRRGERVLEARLEHELDRAAVGLLAQHDIEESIRMISHDARGEIVPRGGELEARHRVVPEHLQLFARSIDDDALDAFPGEVLRALVCIVGRADRIGAGDLLVGPEVELGGQFPQARIRACGRHDLILGQRLRCVQPFDQVLPGPGAHRRLAETRQVVKLHAEDGDGADRSSGQREAAQPAAGKEHNHGQSRQRHDP